MSSCRVVGLPGVDLEAWERGRVFIRLVDLAAVSVRLAAAMPPDLGVVVGIGRSGLLAASAIADYCHLRLFVVSSGCLVPVDGGLRTVDGLGAGGLWAVVDDTVATGGTMDRTCRLLAGVVPRGKLLRVAGVATRSGLGVLDFCGAVLGGPHFLEWNLANSGVGEAAAWDLDGAICGDVPVSALADDESYLAALEAARPWLLPRRRPVVAIVTARPKAARVVTEAWLRRWGVRAGVVVYGPWSSGRGVPGPLEVGHWKAEQLAALGVGRYVESCAAVALEISRSWTGEVVSLGGGVVLGGVRSEKVRAAWEVYAARCVACARS